MKLIAFDPSMTCVGWAVMSREPGAPDTGELVAAGTIRTDALEASETIARIQLIGREAKALVDDEEPSIVAIELPSTFVPSQGRGMQRRGQPNYGMAVGAVIDAASVPFNFKQRRPVTPPRVIGWPPDVWTRSLPTGVRTTRDDKYKTARVEHAARMFNRRPEDFGPKTRAGDVADAVLIGRYAMLATASETMMQQWREGA